MTKALLLALPVCTLITGCGPLTHLTHYSNYELIGKDDMKSPSAVFIDAKQRAVIATKGKHGYRVCSEPSPDALSALASSFGFSVSAEEKAALSQAFTLSEGASSLGLRTQSIQLMRDSLFRLCEAYMSDALSDSAYESQLRNVQSSMVAVLAIEQLTGTQKAPPVTLSGAAKNGAAELADKYTTQSEDQRAKIAVTEKALDAATKDQTAKKEAVTKTQQETAAKKAERDAAQKAYDDANAKTPKPAEAELNKLNEQREKLNAEYEELTTKEKAAVAASTESGNKLTGIQKTLEDQKALYEKFEAVRLAALSGSLSSSVNVEVVNPEGAPKDSAAVIAIAGAVERIVKSVYEIDELRSTCATIINRASTIETGNSTAEKTILQACIEQMNVKIRLDKARNDAVVLQLKDLQATENASLLLDPEARTSREEKIEDINYLLGQ